METKIYKLSEIALNICDGVHNTVIDDPNGLKFLLSAKNIKNGKVNYDITDRRINESTRSRLNKRTKLEKDDVVITTIGTIGEGAVIREDCDYYEFQRSVGIIKPNKKIVLPYYLYYVLTSHYINEYFHILATGAAQPCIFLKTLKNLKIEVPTICNQVKIIDVVQKFDLLIENNNKRIKILEEMVENLYKEWFVRFRFPDYENAEFENGIPKGWNYYKFSEIYTCDRGVSYSTEEIECEEGENLVNLKNIQSFGGFRRDGLKLYNGKYKKQQIVKYKDLVMGVTDMTQDRRTVGAVALIPKLQGVISADLIKLNSNIDNVFSYCLFRFGFYSKLFSQFGNGANVIHLKPSSIKNQKILIPSNDLIKKFVDKVSIMIDEIENLNMVNDNLIKQRDALLPKLMSGKLEI